MLRLQGDRRCDDVLSSFICTTVKCLTSDHTPVSKIIISYNQENLSSMRDDDQVDF